VVNCSSHIKITREKARREAKNKNRKGNRKSKSNYTWKPFVFCRLEIEKKYKHKIAGKSSII
jgi:hypothetical protein